MESTFFGKFEKKKLKKLPRTCQKLLNFHPKGVKHTPIAHNTSHSPEISKSHKNGSNSLKTGPSTYLRPKMESPV